MPSGLYTENNERLKNSERYIDKILEKFKIGDRIKIDNFKIKNYFLNILDVLILVKEKRYSPVNIENPDPRKLTLNEIIEEIKTFKFDLKSTPYENYLKSCMISYFLQSLNYSKSLLSSIWGADGMKIEYPKRDLFNYFVNNIESKNEIIRSIKFYLYQFPEDMFTKTDALKLTEFEETKTSNEIFLEYRILQIKFKILLQEIMLHSYYMSSDEKIHYDNMYRKIIQHLKTYPQGKEIKI